jgi:hypothetical protein
MLSSRLAALDDELTSGLSGNNDLLRPVAPYLHDPRATEVRGLNECCVKSSSEKAA